MAHMFGHLTKPQLVSTDASGGGTYGYLGVILGIMEKKMEATEIIYRGYIGGL